MQLENASMAQQLSESIIEVSWKYRPWLVGPNPRMMDRNTASYHLSIRLPVNIRRRPLSDLFFTVPRADRFVYCTEPPASGRAESCKA